MLDTIQTRYNKGYITDDQLDRYVALNVITQEEANVIKGDPVTPPVTEDAVAKSELDAAYEEGVNSYV